MTYSITVRFQKLDKFENPVFICNKTKELESYTKLTKFYRQLSKRFDSFLPIYSDSEKEYATIRIRKNSDFNGLCENDVHEITFDIKKKDNKLTVYGRSMELVSKAVPFDEVDDFMMDGDDFELDDSKDDMSTPLPSPILITRSISKSH